ncbi:MAG TPA: hypothetical protein DIS66_05905, partial [Candidatus Omnitrophica bacterium]|nr:hypothetical protein [Candidatus Omnitrophota bacterium]
MKDPKEDSLARELSCAVSELKNLLAFPDSYNSLKLRSVFENIIAKTKLIIWDMDETFWSGVLKEGTLKYSDKNHRLLVKLAEHGIVHSVCSNNNEVDVAAVLKQHDVEQYFVFSKISWGSKGPMVKAIIESFQLRPQSVLFLDDNSRIRKEVEFFNPGVSTLDPLDFFKIDENILVPKDKSLKKIAEYKLLERKFKAQLESNSSNEQFLR